MISRKNLIRLTGSLLLMVFLIYFLAKNIDLKEAEIIYSQAKLVPLLLGSAAYIGTYFLRTTRFKILLENKINYLELFGIVAVHNFFVNLLPARLGEISYIRMIHKRKINVSKNVKSLLLSRLLDLAVIALLFLVFYNFSSVDLGRPFFIISIFISIAIFTFLFNHKIFLYPIEKVTKRFSSSFGKRLNAWVVDLRKEFDATSKNRLVILFMLSTLIWILSFIFNYLLLLSLGVQVNLINVLLVVSVILFVSMIPIYTPAGFGAVEGVWASGLILYGIAKQTAILAGIYLHMIQLLLAVILAGVGFVILRRNHN